MMTTKVWAIRDLRNAWFCPPLIGRNFVSFHLHKTFISFCLFHLLLLLIVKQACCCRCILNHTLSVSVALVFFFEKTVTSRWLFTPTRSDHVWRISTLWAAYLLNVHSRLTVGSSYNYLATWWPQFCSCSPESGLDEFVHHKANQQKQDKVCLIEGHGRVVDKWKVLVSDTCRGCLWL